MLVRGRAEIGAPSVSDPKAGLLITGLPSHHFLPQYDVDLVSAVPEAKPLLRALLLFLGMPAECKIRSLGFEMPWFGGCHPWSSLSSKQLQQQWAVPFEHLQRVLQWFLLHVAWWKEPQEKGKAPFKALYHQSEPEKNPLLVGRWKVGGRAKKGMTLCLVPVHLLLTKLDTGISFSPWYGRGSWFRKVKSLARSHTASEESRDDLTQMTWMAWEGVWRRKNFPSVLCWSPPSS